MVKIQSTIPPIETHCIAGHAKTEANTYTDPAGHRHCRTCSRRRTTAWHHGTAKQRYKAERIQKREAYQLPPLGSPNYDPLFGAWLSGLVDGEGYFLATLPTRGLNCRFGVNLRADDGEILYEIQRVLGAGKMNYHRRRSTAPETHRPQYSFVIRDLMDLYQIVLPQFDTYPLRAKKARDYAVWREIIILAAAHRRTPGTTLVRALYGKLAPLVQALHQGREYRGPCPAYNPVNKAPPPGRRSGP